MTTPDHTPSVLFVCVKNAGKSQMAAALMRRRTGDRVRVYSAGTSPGQALNAESVAALAEVGAPTAGEHPKALDAGLLRSVDRIVILGAEARLPDTGVDPTAIERWLNDEPSDRGITGAERMRLIRDDIDGRVAGLAERLTS